MRKSLLFVTIVFFSILLRVTQSAIICQTTHSNNISHLAPKEPFTLSLSAEGPYRAPANIELVASVTHPKSTSITNIEFYNSNNLLGNTTIPPYEFQLTNYPSGNYTIEAKAYDSTGATTTAIAQIRLISLPLLLLILNKVFFLMGQIKMLPLFFQVVIILRYLGFCVLHPHC